MAGKKAKAKARKQAAPPVPLKIPQMPLAAVLAADPDYAEFLHSYPADPSGEGTQTPYFEIKLCPGKGLGAFATRPIKAGTQVFREQPVVVINKPRENISEQDIVKEYLRLRPAEKYKFDTMRNCHGLCGCKSGLFFANTFGLELGATGCYPICSRLNHSCQANCAIATSDSFPEKMITALKDVDTGDELTFHYIQNVQYMTTDQRRHLFESGNFGFTCMCELCSLPAVDRFASDCRRRMMRRLLYWMEDGTDLEGVPTVYTDSPIGDINEKGMSSCLLLFSQLVEAEGVIAGDRPGLSFVKLILFVFFKARANKVADLPPATLRKVRHWWAMASALGAGGSRVAFFDEYFWDQARAFVDALADSGGIDWDALHPYRAPDSLKWLDVCQGKVQMVRSCHELEKLGQRVH